MSDDMKKHILKKIVPQSLTEGHIMHNLESATFQTLKDWMQQKAKALATQHSLTHKVPQNLVVEDLEDDKIEDFINPDTWAETEVIGDAGLRTLREHDIIQLERRGFYRVDRPYVNEGKTLMLFMIPDGKKKAMSGLDGKLAHR